jgi:hypothetical protein
MEKLLSGNVMCVREGRYHGKSHRGLQCFRSEMADFTSSKTSLEKSMHVARVIAMTTERITFLQGQASDEAMRG